MKRSLLPIILGLSVLGGCDDDSLMDAGLSDGGQLDAVDAALFDGGFVDGAQPDGSQPDAGEADVSLRDGGVSDVTTDVPGDAGPGDYGPAVIIGDGMRCEVASAYNPTDIASRGTSHWLAVGDRVVRVDELFGNPVEELVTDGVVVELHATEDHLVALVDRELPAPARDERRLFVRELDGTWVDATPEFLQGNDEVTGNQAIFVLAGNSIILRYNGAWTTLERPSGIISSFSVHNDHVFIMIEEVFWIHDGSSWSSYPTSSLSDAPGPPQPATVTLQFVRALSDTEFVFAYGVRRLDDFTRGLAAFEAGVFTVLTDEIPGTVQYVGGQYLVLTGPPPMLVSDDAVDWRPAPYTASSVEWPGRVLSVDQQTLWSVASWGVYRLTGDTWEQAMAPSMPSTILKVSPDARLAPAPAYGVVHDRDMERSTFVRWDGAWSDTEIEGPPPPSTRPLHQIAWAGDVAYFLQPSVSWEYRIIAHRWHAGVDETLGGYVVAEGVFANRFGAYMTRESGGGSSTFVHQAVGDAFAPHSVGRGCSSMDGLVLAGPGLVLVDCYELRSDSYWWDGTDWNAFSRSTHQGYVDDGTTQTAIFRTEAEPYIWSAFDGTDWTTPDVSWAPDSAYFEGSAFDQVVASYPNGLSWKRGDDVATAEDSRFGPAQGVVTSERALLMTTTLERRYTFDCVPDSL